MINMTNGAMSGWREISSIMLCCSCAWFWRWMGGGQAVVIIDWPCTEVLDELWGQVVVVLGFAGMQGEIGGGGYKIKACTCIMSGVSSSAFRASTHSAMTSDSAALSKLSISLAKSPALVIRELLPYPVCLEPVNCLARWCCILHDIWLYDELEII